LVSEHRQVVYQKTKKWELAPTFDAPRPKFASKPALSSWQTVTGHLREIHARHVVEHLAATHVQLQQFTALCSFIASTLRKFVTAPLYVRDSVSSVVPCGIVDKSSAPWDRTAHGSFAACYCRNVIYQRRDGPNSPRVVANSQG